MRPKLKCIVGHFQVLLYCILNQLIKKQRKKAGHIDYTYGIIVNKLVHITIMFFPTVSKRERIIQYDS